MSIRKLIRKVTVTVNECEVAQSFTLEYFVLERETFVDGICRRNRFKHVRH